MIGVISGIYFQFITLGDVVSNRTFMIIYVFPKERKKRGGERRRKRKGKEKEKGESKGKGEGKEKRMKEIAEGEKEGRSTLH